MGFYYAVFEPKEDFVACGYDRWLCKCIDVDEGTKIERPVLNAQQEEQAEGQQEQQE